MKITLAIVTSLDGKSTKGKLSPNKWASKEDQSHFSSLISHHNLIVMGKNTYLLRKPHLKLSQNKLRVVLTRDPKKFIKDRVAGQLEFTSEPPKELVKRLASLGSKEMLLVSGASLNTLFFKEKLINEILLTIEPVVFGTGKGLVNEENLHIKLKLLNIKKLNFQGTLLLKYAVA